MCLFGIRRQERLKLNETPEEQWKKELSQKIETKRKNSKLSSNETENVLATYEKFSVANREIGIENRQEIMSKYEKELDKIEQKTSNEQLLICLILLTILVLPIILGIIEKTFF